MTNNPPVLSFEQFMETVINSHEMPEFFEMAPGDLGNFLFNGSNQGNRLVSDENERV